MSSFLYIFLSFLYLNFKYDFNNFSEISFRSVTDSLRLKKSVSDRIEIILSIVSFNFDL